MSPTETTTVRPPLTHTINVADFRDFYWLKAELMAFCREVGLSTQGGKVDIAERIAQFLETGEVDATPSPIRKRDTLPNVPLTLDTVIHEGFVCTQRHRDFFKSVIGPHFRFSTFIQNYFKTHVGKTYGDAVEVWVEEERRQKAGAPAYDIAPQFEYNRFMRSFFEDPANHGKGRKEAIGAWHEHRSQRKG